ncbi:MAG: alpha-L-fucosidase, partial [Acidobacteria bacterium]|nr:alpha-L-fucosidase [Acidobacteriota bacterium]
TIWFDGEWEHTTAELHSDEIYDLIRSIQPNTLINDRLYKRQRGNRADYGTPEQFVPATGMRDPAGKPVLWESCVTINTESWGYNKYETKFKTSRDLIRMLIDVVSKGGNLLLNVGPMPDGRIQPEFVTRLEAMGSWLRTYGEAIYSTTASPFSRLPFFGRATVRGNHLYLLVFEWPSDGKLRLPGLKNLVHSARVVGIPGSHLTIHRQGEEVVVELPAGAPDEVASVVEVTLDGMPSVLPYRLTPGRDGILTAGAASSEVETRSEPSACSSPTGSARAMFRPGTSGFPRRDAIGLSCAMPRAGAWPDARSRWRPAPAGLRERCRTRGMNWFSRTSAWEAYN